MASIQKRKNSWAVVYNYKLPDGTRKQKWENFSSYKEARKRKAEVENDIEFNKFVAPSKQTLSEYLDSFINIYGTENWSPSTYHKNCGYIVNYVDPHIGKLHLQEITPLIIEKYYIQLSKLPSVDKRYDCVTSGTILKIHKLLKTAFKTAKLWDLIINDPYDKVRTPKHVYEKREIWDSQTIIKALKVCDDPKLAIAIHLSFACSLRIGEVLGLQWKNVHISDEDIAANNARLDVNCQLEELPKTAIESSNVGEIFFKFPSASGNNTNSIKVLKTPKTESSVRTVWLPNTLAEILKKWKQEQEKYKEYYADSYFDYDLVVCLENGRPCSHRTIGNSLKRLIKLNDLPPIVFHSFRHASTTYKLKLNHGDIKATQGDTGHAQADMITELYAHILDEDRKLNAQKFDESFYSLTGEKVERKQEKVNIDELINAMKADPDLLKQVLSALK